MPPLTGGQQPADSNPTPCPHLLLFEVLGVHIHCHLVLQLVPLVPVEGKGGRGGQGQGQGMGGLGFPRAHPNACNGQLVVVLHACPMPTLFLSPPKKQQHTPVLAHKLRSSRGCLGQRLL